MLLNPEPKRTPEQGHTAPCLAQAMICAIENARDLAISEAHGDEHMAQFDFRSMAQDNVALTWADGYLSDGTATCTCPMLTEHEPDEPRPNGCNGY